MIDVGADGRCEFPDGGERASADRLAVITERKYSTMFSQEQLAGTKCRVIRLLAGRASHLRTSACL